MLECDLRSLRDDSDSECVGITASHLRVIWMDTGAALPQVGVSFDCTGEPALTWCERVLLKAGLLFSVSNIFELLHASKIQRKAYW